MNEGLKRLIRSVERVAVWTAAVGGLIVLVQMVWISYGVFTRYGLGKPDRLVTEATALLLFPVAFAGLAFALREEAMPKVTMVIDRFGPRTQQVFAIVNHFIMLMVGAFFAYAGVSATIRALNSGVASEILHWPRWWFWAPGATALIIFALYVALKLVLLIRTPLGEGES